MYEVCPSPFQPSSTPGCNHRASATAQAYGVAGSCRSPTTRTGGADTAAPGVADAADSTGWDGTGQEAQGSDPYTSVGPNNGATLAAAAAAPCHAPTGRGQARSRQLTAVPTSERLL